MGRQKLTRAVGHIGWIAGLAAFLMFGLLQGALVGGTFGMETGAYIFGYEASGGETISRIMAAAGMVAGVAIAGAMFITCGLAVGRLAGMLIGQGGAHAGTGMRKGFNINRN